MSESKNAVMAALAACLGLGLLLTGCGQVVGADCANGGEYCGGVCCPDPYSCQNQVCVLPDGGGITGDSGACGLLSLLCGTDCIDPQTSSDHCGGCDSACGAGLTCVLGACVDGCSATELFCSGGCVDPLDDDAHCGGCGTACGDGLGCQAGLCVSECGLDEAYCDGACRQIASDDAHCGGCGTACGDGFDCQLGVCVSQCGLDETYCDGACRLIAFDDNHCGGCGNACASDRDCNLTVCVPEPCDLGLAACGPDCRRLGSDPANCGGCGVECGVDQVCELGACVDLCGAPNLVCDDECVAPSIDPENCGTCGTVCESGICRGGACQDATFGHVVLIGHDYTTWASGGNRVVGAATLISLDDDISLLAYEGDAEAASITGVRGALAEVASATGRDINYNGESTMARVPDRLRGADVFLIHAQHGASDAELLNLGFAWRNAMRTFLRGGGVLIVLDAGGANSGTHLLLEAAGLISIDSRRSLPADAALRIVDGTDAVSRGIPVEYLAEARSAGFEMRVSSGVVVATDDAARTPVVIHTVVSP